MQVGVRVTAVNHYPQTVHTAVVLANSPHYKFVDVHEFHPVEVSFFSSLSFSLPVAMSIYHFQQNESPGPLSWSQIILSFISSPPLTKSDGGWEVNMSILSWWSLGRPTPSTYPLYPLPWAPSLSLSMPQSGDAGYKKRSIFLLR